MVLGTKERIVADRQFATERYILSTNPVLYLPLYRLDGASFLSADGIGHTCTATGALWRPNGRYFDGVDNKVTIPDNNAWDLPADSSLLLWFNTGTTASYQELAGTFSVGWTLYCQTQTLKFYNNVEDILVGGAISTNTWYFVAVVRTGNNWEMLVNNVSVSTATNKTVATSTNPLHLGLRQDNTGDYTGLIPEVWIYNRALTPLEIQNLYLATQWRWS